MKILTLVLVLLSSNAFAWWDVNQCGASFAAEGPTVAVASGNAIGICEAYCHSYLSECQRNGAVKIIGPDCRATFVSDKGPSYTINRFRADAYGEVRCRYQ